MLIDLYALAERDLTAVAAQGESVRVSAKPIADTSNVCWVVADEKPAPAGFNIFNPVSKKIANAVGLPSPYIGVRSGFYEITVLELPKYGTVVRISPEGSLETPTWQYEVGNQGFSGWPALSPPSCARWRRTAKRRLSSMDCATNPHQLCIIV
jgi:hypothetical protein